MDYDIWYNGVIIANTTGDTPEEAERNAKFIYGNKVTVELSQ